MYKNERIGALTEESGLVKTPSQKPSQRGFINMKHERAGNVAVRQDQTIVGRDNLK